jgi:hypothetical protein
MLFLYQLLNVEALHELLLYRFPYRCVPRLPPAKLSALVAGVTSETIDTRRKALARWLAAVTSHPIIQADRMVRFFLTEAGAAATADMGAALRELFRHLPDEFVLSENGPRARELATPGLRATVMAAGARLAAMAEAVGRLATILQKLKVRTHDKGN